MYFQVHQPFRFRTYRFFDIGNDHYYYDDYSNESIMRKVADKCYLPANKLMLDLIQKHKGNFKVSYSISGIALKQFELYAPEVLDSFKALAETGKVEFLAETYAHSLASLKDEDEFVRQVNEHRALIKDLFGQEARVFRNTELIYSDEIGARVYKLGFKAMLTEGAKHVLGWKSPNYLYCNAIEPRMKVLMKNFKLSDDIAFRFSNKGWAHYPLTAKKFTNWLKEIPKEEENINLFMDYETFGEHQWEETGIFDFLSDLPNTVMKNTDYTFRTPSEVAKELQVASAVHVPFPISWADEERDLSAWLGNEMQQEAFNKLYELKENVYASNDAELLLDFRYLQVSDHFYYMSTKFFSDGEVHSYFNPYNTPYEAFINFMNVLSDFKIRVDAANATSVDQEISKLSKIISEQNRKLQKQEEEINHLKKKKTSASPAKSFDSANKSKKTPSSSKSRTSTSKAKPSVAKSANSPMKERSALSKPTSASKAVSGSSAKKSPRQKPSAKKVEKKNTGDSSDK